MKYVYFITMALEFSFLIFFGMIAWEQTGKALSYERLFENSRAQIEALYRTKGFRGIDSAFDCRLKTTKEKSDGHTKNTEIAKASRHQHWTDAVHHSQYHIKP
jgi:hypothetical protein